MFKNKYGQNTNYNSLYNAVSTSFLKTSCWIILIAISAWLSVFFIKYYFFLPMFAIKFIGTLGIILEGITVWQSYFKSWGGGRSPADELSEDVYFVFGLLGLYLIIIAYGLE